MSTIAKRLREERERISVSQSDFASHCGVSKVTQINYESGKRSPNAAYLAKAAQYGLRCGYVITGEVEQKGFESTLATGKQSDTIESITDRIIQYRKAAKQTPLEFAAHIGYPPGEYVAIEDGRSPLRMDLLIAIVGKIMSLNRDWLLTGEGDMEVDFEHRLGRLQGMTDRVMRLAQKHRRKPDPIQLGELRDVGLQASLRDEQIELLLRLLEKASQQQFWLTVEE